MSLERFPVGTTELLEIGYRLVSDTGDHDLRIALDVARNGGGLDD